MKKSSWIFLGLFIALIIYLFLSDPPSDSPSPTPTPKPTIDSLTCFQEGNKIIEEKSSSGFTTDTWGPIWHWNDDAGNQKSLKYVIKRGLFQTEYIPCIGHIPSVERPPERNPSSFKCFHSGKQILDTETDNGIKERWIDTGGATMGVYIWTNAEGTWFINLPEQITCNN